MKICKPTTTTPCGALAGALLLCVSPACKEPEAATQPPTDGEPSALDSASTSPGTSATATLGPASGSEVTGTVTFSMTDDGKVEVTYEVSGLTPGEHGFHIHENGDCSAPDATSAGGHYAPAGDPHGAPGSAQHHAGDFGNITADDAGVAKGSWTVDFIALQPDAEAPNIVGKAVVVHADSDDLKSQPSGNAGARVACGVIEGV